MTRRIKELLRKMGFIVVRTSNVNARYVAQPALGPFDEALLRAFPDLHGLTFIQVGANDGARFDPLRRYVAAYGWRGLLVEPDPRYFQDLQANYRGIPGLRFLPAAVDTVRGERPLYYIDADMSRLPEWARGVGSLDQAHVAAVATRLGLRADAIASRPVRAVPWDDVFLAAGVEAPDIVVLDTEGHDAALIHSLDFTRHAPQLLHFEHAHCSRAERLQVYDRLIDHGYDFVSAEHDTTAYRIRPRK